MVEIAAIRLVFATDIDYGEIRIVEIRLHRLATDNRRIMNGDKKAAREELILM
jgi:hypothetical protein